MSHRGAAKDNEGASEASAKVDKISIDLSTDVVETNKILGVQTLLLFGLLAPLIGECCKSMVPAHV